MTEYILMYLLFTELVDNVRLLNIQQVPFRRVVHMPSLSATKMCTLLAY